jgi:hypothetical protein
MPLAPAATLSGEDLPQAAPEPAQPAPERTSAPLDRPVQAAAPALSRPAERETLPDRPAAAPAAEQVPAAALGHRLEPARTAPPEAEATAPAKSQPAPASEPAPQRPAAPPREIQLRLGETAREPGVEVRVKEQAGELKVAVRSPNTGLTESLRAGLPELVDRLGQRGFETQVWRPASAESHGASSARQTELRPAESAGSSPDGGGSGQRQDGAGERRNPDQGEESPLWSQEWEDLWRPPEEQEDRSNLRWLQT